MEAIEMSPSLAKGAAVPLTSVVVDALPYIDMGYDDPGVREAVRYSLFPISLLNTILGLYYVRST